MPCKQHAGHARDTAWLLPAVRVQVCSSLRHHPSTHAPFCATQRPLQGGVFQPSVRQRWRDLPQPVSACHRRGLAWSLLLVLLSCTGRPRSLGSAPTRLVAGRHQHAPPRPPTHTHTRTRARTTAVAHTPACDPPAGARCCAASLSPSWRAAAAAPAPRGSCLAGSHSAPPATGRAWRLCAVQMASRTGTAWQHRQRAWRRRRRAPARVPPRSAASR
jgi:hypothetical protein